MSISKITDMVFSEMSEAFLRGDNVRITNFGTFKNVVRKPIKGRNPNKPDEIIMIPERQSVSFKLSPKIKEKMNKK